MDGLIDQSGMSFAAALLAGVTYGVVYCGPSCGPFLCTYIMGTQAAAPTRSGAMHGLRALAVFNTARILTYGVIGAGSALLGTTMLSATGESHNSSMIFGGAVVVLGVLMWMRPDKNRNQNGSQQSNLPSRACAARHLRFKPTTPLWVIGAAFALAPCPPLLAMLAYCSQTGSPLDGAALLMLFGAGTAASPLVLMTVLAGSFSRTIRTQAPQYTVLFERTSSVILVILGITLFL